MFNFNLRVIGLIALVSFSNTLLCAQRKLKTEKLFQFSIAPGVGTNGLEPGSFNNHFSFNLTSGYSASNSVLEIAMISNLNTNRTGGLQFAGLANLTGANAFAGLQPKEKDAKLRSGFEANLVGAQFSGVTNVVITNVFGSQITGGVNLVKGALMGFQLAGVSNVVHKYSFGVQVAGISNASQQSMDGVQVALLSNYTSGGLYGVQVGVFNKIGYSEGKNSTDNNDATGIQIGLVNDADKMNGLQIGLINRGKHVQGTQIGLINIYRGGKDKGTKDGTSIGLINIGDFGYLAVYANEMFGFNYELSTGNIKNKRMQADRNINIQSTLIYSRNAWGSDRNGQWAFGYGLKKMIFNRSFTPGMNEFRFHSFGIDFIHLNKEARKIAKEFNLLSRFNVMVGTRLAPKLLNVYVFGGLTANVYYGQIGDDSSSGFLSWDKEANGKLIKYWPGISFGVLLH